MAELDLKNLPEHGSLLVFGKSRLKQQRLTSTLNSDGVKIPNFFFLKTSKILKIAAGDQHALFSSQNRTYSFGLNDWGQLGVKQELKQELNKPNLIKPLKNYKILDVSCGRSHNLILCSDTENVENLNSRKADSQKSLYSLGSNTDSQLGIPGSSATYTPLTITTKKYPLFPKNISKIVSGSDFNLALTIDGLIYGWGDNDAGQLGDKILGAEVSTPTKINLSKNFKQNSSVGNIFDVVCGYHSTILLMSSGLILAAGENFGTEFSSLVTPEPVKMVAISGNGRILFLSREGNVYLSEEPEESEENDGKFLQPVFKSVKIPTKSNEFITQISAGYHHFAVITNQKNLLTYGDNSNGQLCLGNKISNFSGSFKKVTFCENELNYTAVACGGNFTICSVSPKGSLMKNVSFSGYEPDEDENLPDPGQKNQQLNTIPEEVEQVGDATKSGGLFSSCKSKPKAPKEPKPEPVASNLPPNQKSKSCHIL